MTVVSVRAGGLRQVVPESLRFYFEIVARDCVCEGARLELEEVAVRLGCEECGHEWEPEMPVFHCPECGATAVKVLAGDELEVDYIEVSDSERLSETGRRASQSERGAGRPAEETEETRQSEEVECIGPR